MSLLIKALNKADEVQAEKTKKTQTTELALEDSTIDKLPSEAALDFEFSMSLAKEAFDEPFQAPTSKQQKNSRTSASVVSSKPQVTRSNETVINQAAAKNAANVFAAKGVQAKTASTRLALIAGAGLIVLLGMGLYFYQFVDNSPPIVLLPRPLEQLDNAAQNPPVQTAAIEETVSISEPAVEPEPPPAIEPSLPPAFVPAQHVEVATGNKTKKLRSDSLIADDDNKALVVDETVEKNAALQDSLADNEEDVSRLESSFSANKVAKKTRKSKISSAIASESASISVTKSTSEPGVSPILMSAYEAYNAGKDVEAQKLYKQVLKRDIQNVDALLGLGAIAARQGRSADANSWYGKVLELEPRNSIAKAFMLDNQSQGNELSNETSLKNMLAKQPNDANLHVALGNLYAEQNQWPAAQQAYFDAYSLNKTTENAYNLAVSLDQMGKPKLALPYYQRALEQAGDSNVIDKAALQARVTAIQ